MAGIEGGAGLFEFLQQVEYGAVGLLELEQAQFEASLKARNVKAREIGKVEGLNYSNGDDTTLRVYAPIPSEGQ